MKLIFDMNKKELNEKGFYQIKESSIQEFLDRMYRENVIGSTYDDIQILINCLEYHLKYLKKQFRILTIIGDCVLIEKTNNPNRIHPFEAISLTLSLDHALHCADIDKEDFLQKIDEYKREMAVA